MATLTILISDIDDEVEVSCKGETEIKDKATPAQHLANKLMEKAGQLLKKGE